MVSGPTQKTRLAVMKPSAMRLGSPSRASRRWNQAPSASSPSCSRSSSPTTTPPSRPPRTARSSPGRTSSLVKMGSAMEMAIRVVKKPRAVVRLCCMRGGTRAPASRPSVVPISTVATLSRVPVRNMRPIVPMLTR